MVIHTPIGLFQKFHNTLCCLSKFCIALFSISLGAKGLLSTHSLASFVIDLSSFNQVNIFFLNASNSSVSLIVDWWTECCFSQCILMHCQVPCVSTVFNQEPRYVIEWVSNFYSLNAMINDILLNIVFFAEFSLNANFLCVSVIEVIFLNWQF